MIESHTLAVPGVATQLPYLLKQARMADHPLWLTTTEDTEPIAVVIEVSEYERTQKRQNLFYEWQRLHLKEWLDRVEKFWDNELLKEECVRVLQDDILKLWEVAPRPVQPFVAGLTLSARKINAQTFSKKQLSALQYCLEAVRDVTPDEASLGTAYQCLMQSGISPKPSFDEDLIQLYLNEL